MLNALEPALEWTVSPSPGQEIPEEVGMGAEKGAAEVKMLGLRCKPVSSHRVPAKVMPSRVSCMKTNKQQMSLSQNLQQM